MKTVTLHGEKAAGRAALVDDEDYALVAAYRWRVLESDGGPARWPIGPYAITQLPRVNGRQPTLYMHNLITGWPMTDHEDHDGLNNQRYNLRQATNTQNQANKRPRFGTTSRYKGVTLLPARRKWRAQINFNGTARFLGHFANEEDAALAYNAAALEVFGPYACLNEIEAA